MNRLQELRKQKKLTLEKVARSLNIGTSTLSQYENGKREANYEMLCNLASFFDVSIDYLLGESSDKPKSKGVKIPVLGVIPAGVPIEAVEDVLDYEEISEDMASRGEYFALKVRGDSMLPTIANGDIVIVRQQDDADSGKICVVMINGYDATLKEIKKEPDCNFKPTFYTNKEIIETPVKILGVAVEIRRGL